MPPALARSTQTLSKPRRSSRKTTPQAEAVRKPFPLLKQCANDRFVRCADPYKQARATSSPTTTRITRAWPRTSTLPATTPSQSPPLALTTGVAAARATWSLSARVSRKRRRSALPAKARPRTRNRACLNGASLRWVWVPRKSRRRRR